MADSDQQTAQRRHPGAGRGRARAFPKGRQVEPAALAEVRDLLAGRGRSADLLIEHLHRLQDRFGHLAHRHLAALAQEMRLAMAEVYEVATFYHAFDVVADGGPPPPAVTLRVCDGLPCRMAGGEALGSALAAAHGPAIRVMPAACMGRCDAAPVVRVGGERYVTGADAGTVAAELPRAAEPACPAPPPASLAASRADGVYDALLALHAGTLAADDVLSVLEASGLRGLGGAGFPTARKWRLVRGHPGPRHAVVNADESEPGTFKDRLLLERSAHQVLAGALIAAFVVEAAALHVYLRDEYPHLRRGLEAAIAELGALGLDLPPVHLRRGAGAYICGEESALLESLEGRRGLPRHKPPFPAEVGLFGRPTLVNNVETLWFVPLLLRDGPGLMTGAGRRGRTGMRHFSVSGRVRRPGVRFAPAGISVRELIDEHCGGMLPGHEFRAYLPGGASGGVLPASLGDLPLDFGTLEPYGCFVGSHAVMVLSDADDIGDVALQTMRFFEDESCGQCTPCRVGTAKAVALMQGRRWDTGLLAELSACMADASICGLGQAAPNVLRTALRHLPDRMASRCEP